MTEKVKNNLEIIEEKINDMNLYTKARMYGIYQNHEEDMQKMKPIHDQVRERRDLLEEIYPMENGIHIVKVLHTYNKKREINYLVFLDFEKQNNVFYSYPEAVLGAFALKYQGYNSQMDVAALRLFEIPLQKQATIVE